MFEAFQESDYRRFWVSQFFSNIGSWMQTVAQGYLVYRLTDSPFLPGFVGFANAIPSFFLMLFGGVLADHLDRRFAVKVSQWAQALSAFALSLLIWTGHLHVWHIVTAAVVSGIAISFSAPAWQQNVESTDALCARPRAGFAYDLTDRGIILVLCVAAAASAFGYPYTTLI